MSSCWVSYVVSLPPDPPSTPRNLRVVDLDRDRVTLAWEEPETDGGAKVTQYLIDMRSELDVEYITVGKVTGDVMSYTATNLIEGTDYNFRVRARNPAGLSQQGAELAKPVTAKAPFGE